MGYDYKEVVTNETRVSFLIDGYKNFGWIVDENNSTSKVSNLSYQDTKVVIRFKRDRKIINKAELTRLQRNFDFCIKEINKMEKSKTSRATIYSLSIGMIGTVFMAGSVFAVTAGPPKIALCVVLAIPAFIGWISPYFIYKYIASKRIETVNLLIDEKKDEIFEICEKGNKLLY